MSNTKKGTLIAIGYLVVCAIVVWLGDFVCREERPFISNVSVGLLTIIGGFLLAYWFIERRKLEREDELEQERIKNEKERKKRIISVLTVFKRSLLPWIFNYACILSGHFQLYDNHRIYNGKYLEDIPELEDIFAIGTCDSSGKQLRGTECWDSTNKEINERPLTPQSLYHTLRYSLKSLEPIERQLIEFPSLVGEVEPEVAKIVHLSHDIQIRIKELEDWEKNQEQRVPNTIDTATKSNLQAIGREALDIVIAIDANIRKLASEIEN